MTIEKIYKRLLTNLKNGKIIQIGTAQELSDHPTNSFVKDFLEIDSV